MEAHVRYRPVAFGDDAVQVREASGATYVRAAAPLGSYALRTMDRLRHWGNEAPGRSFIELMVPDEISTDLSRTRPMHRLRITTSPWR